MAGSRALICATAGRRRLTARSLLVPKTFASMLLSKPGILQNFTGIETPKFKFTRCLRSRIDGRGPVLDADYFMY